MNTPFANAARARYCAGMASASLLLYGCYGYTGRLIADEALRRGLRPTLAGRDRALVEEMGHALDLPTRVFSLDDPAQLDSALAGHAVVLHAAGPFSKTATPMVEACLRAGAHYLDITGEIGVFESIASRDGAARAAGVSLLPGVGFDVVPSDCLAAYVAAKLPDASELTIALQMLGQTSQGTALTMVENLGKGGAIRDGGRIVAVPPGHRQRSFDFGDGPRPAVAIPWGDVSTAFYSTKIPHIEVYLAAPRAMILGMRATRFLGPLLGTGPVQRFLAARIKAGPAGPSDEQRSRGRSRLYAEALTRDGRRAAAHLEGPEGYTLTAITAVRAAEKILAGGIATGFPDPVARLRRRLRARDPGRAPPRRLAPQPGRSATLRAARSSSTAARRSSEARRRGRAPSA